MEKNTVYINHSDGELLKLLGKADVSAFSELYERYYKKMYRYLFSLVQLPDLTEDLVQDVFIKVWVKREQLEELENFNGYLFRMAHNTAVDMTRKIATDEKLKGRLLKQYQSVFQEYDRTPAELERMDALVELALENLTPHQRRVYELVKLQGMKYKEAAEHLGISAWTVKEHLSNATNTLRTFLRDRGELAVTLFLFDLMVNK